MQGFNMDLSRVPFNNYLCLASLNIASRADSSVDKSAGQRMINELEECLDHRSIISKSPNNFLVSIFGTPEKRQQEGSLKDQSRLRLSLKDASTKLQQQQHIQTKEENELYQESKNRRSRGLSEEEANPKQLFSNWAFDSYESHYYQETNFFSKNETEQNLDSLSSYQEFKTPAEKSLTLMKCEIECEDQIEQKDCIKRSESMSNSLSPKLEEDQQPIAKDEWIDFSQAVIINPFLDSFSNWLMSSQQALFVSEKPPPKKRCTDRISKKVQDVGRHFLKVHIKKCFNHALQNSSEVYDALRDIYTENQYNTPQHFRQQIQSFVFSKLKEFNQWLSNLKKRFKDYSKDDFKDAYLVNHKLLQGEVLNLQEKDLSDFIIERSEEWDVIIFKMALRKASLKFIRDPSDSGLRFQLKNANNITIEAEHQRYVILTEWLIERPSRIDYSEVFGRRWVANFFETREVNKETF